MCQASVQFDHGFGLYLAFLFLYVWLRKFCTSAGEQGMVDEAQKALEEAEALKKVFICLSLSLACGIKSHFTFPLFPFEEPLA